jgi:flavin-dependent dehydrogenase
MQSRLSDFRRRVYCNAPLCSATDGYEKVTGIEPTKDSMIDCLPCGVPRMFVVAKKPANGSTMPDEQYDAVVVGAGPAGSAMAIHLARAGWRMLLVDAARFPRHKVCGECLGAVALPLLDDLGIGNALRRDLIWHDELRIVLPSGQQVRAPLERSGPLALVSISRYALDALLLEQARAAGAEILLEHRARRLIIGDSRVQGVVVSSVRHIGEECVLSGRVVVAADGRDSLLVKETGFVSASGESCVGFKRHRAAGCESSHSPSILEMHSFAGGYLGICQADRSAINYCGLVPRNLLRAARGSIREVLRQHLAKNRQDHRWDDVLEDGHWLTTANVQQQRARPRLPGIIYAGDAQGTIEPLAGQGISMALAGAHLAAGLLIANTRRSADQRLQREYERRWLEEFSGPIAWGARFGWWLRRPKLLAQVLSVPYLARQYEAKVLRWGYRTTRLPAATIL